MWPCVPVLPCDSHCVPTTLPKDSRHSHPLSFWAYGVLIWLTVFSHHAGGGWIQQANTMTMVNQVTYYNGEPGCQVSLRGSPGTVWATELPAAVMMCHGPAAGSDIWEITPCRARQKRCQIYATLLVTRNRMPLSPANMLQCLFFFPFLILISKLYHHCILMCSFLKAVYHINGSVYRCEYFPCTVICNPLISTSCTLLVHIQFNL